MEYGGRNIYAGFTGDSGKKQDVKGKDNPKEKL